MKKCGQRVAAWSNPPAGSHSCSIGTKTRSKTNVRLNVARMPSGSHSPTMREAITDRRHTEEPDAVVAWHLGDDVVDVRRLRQRGEDLAPADQIATVHRLGRGRDALGRARRVALAERLGVEHAPVDDARVQDPPVGIELGAFFGGPRQVVGDLAGEQHRDAVHVVGERGRGRVPAELVAHPAVVGEARSEPTPRHRDAQREESNLTEVGEVVVREARLAVMAFGSLGEHGAELGGRGDERPAVGRAAQRIISWTK